MGPGPGLRDTLADRRTYTIHGKRCLGQSRAKRSRFSHFLADGRQNINTKINSLKHLSSSTPGCHISCYILSRNMFNPQQHRKNVTAIELALEGLRGVWCGNREGYSSQYVYICTYINICTYIRRGMYASGFRPQSSLVRYAAGQVASNLFRAVFPDQRGV